MKTKNNVQKAILRSAAVVVSFVLISFTVSAQEFWKNLLINSSFGDIALAMSEDATTNSTADNADFAAASMFIETENETGLELEDWMTDDSNFGIATLDLEAATDDTLELEGWMMDQNLFDTAEKPLELEAWMVSEEVWE